MEVSRLDLFGIDMYIDCRIRVKRCGSGRVYCICLTDRLGVSGWDVVIPWRTMLSNCGLLLVTLSASLGRLWAVESVGTGEPWPVF